MEWKGKMRKRSAWILMEKEMVGSMKRCEERRSGGGNVPFGLGGSGGHSD